MTILDFKPYQFPIPSAAGWEPFLNTDEAKAYIAPRGNVTGFLIPKKSKRYILVTFEESSKVFDRRGRRLKNLNPKVREVLGRMPPRSAVDAYISKENVTIIDVLYYHDMDVRGQRLGDRLGFWWFMPEDYRNRSLYNEHDSDKLDGDIFKEVYSKIIFKPDFVVYPKTTSRQKVYNWLEAKAPKGKLFDGPTTAPGNLSNLMLRQASLRGATRIKEIR